MKHHITCSTSILWLALVFFFASTQIILSSAMTFQVYENSILGGIAVHPALDGNALNRLCTEQGAQTTRITSASSQSSLELAMQNAGADKAYLGARFASDLATGDWVWMSDNWETDGYVFCHFYAPCTPLLYTNWAPGFPSYSGSPLPINRFVLHEIASNGWCNRQGLGLTKYYVACTFDDTSFENLGPVTSGLPIGEDAGNGNNNGGNTNNGAAADDKDGFPTWAIAVIVVGCVVMLAIIIIPIVVCCCCLDEYEDSEEDEDSEEEEEERPRSSRSSSRSMSADNTSVRSFDDNSDDYNIKYNEFDDVNAFAQQGGPSRAAARRMVH